MSDQDWIPVRIQRRTPDTALRPGVSRPNTAATQDQKKSYNYQASLERKLMNADEPVKLKSLSLTSRKLIAQKRAEKELSQIQLNSACSFPQNTIRDIEAGKYTPSPSQLSTLNHILKTSLKLE